MIPILRGFIHGNHGPDRRRSPPPQNRLHQRGGRGAQAQLSAWMKRIRVPSGDLTDFRLAKGSLADWLRFHMTDPA